MNRSESKYFNTAARMDKAFLELLDEKDFPFITVKDVCERAGVNRSTFYLHYENFNDLLEESLESMNQEFFSYFEGADTQFVQHVKDGTAANLNTVTPEFLIPYLTYVKDHKRLVLTAFKQTTAMRSEKTYEQLFQHVFTPVFERLHVPTGDRQYLVTFYVHGLMAIVVEWVNNDCTDDIDHIAELMQRCVSTGSFSTQA